MVTLVEGPPPTANRQQQWRSEPADAVAAPPAGQKSLWGGNCGTADLAGSSGAPGPAR